MAGMSVMYSIIFIPFSLVDMKREMDRFCFKNLKNTSISQCFQYVSAICFGVRLRRWLLGTPCSQSFLSCLCLHGTWCHVAT